MPDEKYLSRIPQIILNILSYTQNISDEIFLISS